MAPPLSVLPAASALPLGDAAVFSSHLSRLDGLFLEAAGPDQITRKRAYVRARVHACVHGGSLQSPEDGEMSHVGETNVEQRAAVAQMKIITLQRPPHLVLIIQRAHGPSRTMAGR